MILGLSAMCAQAQFYFNSRHTLNSFTSIFTSVLHLNEKYYCTGVSWDSSNHLGNGVAIPIWGVRLAVFDSAGTKVHDTVYQLRPLDVGMPQSRSLFPWRNNLLASPDGNLLLTAESHDSAGIMRVAIIKMDTLGQVLMHKEYDAPSCIAGTTRNFFQARDLKPDGYGNWIMLSTGACASPQQSTLVLTKLDSSFNVLWHREKGSSGLDEVATRLIIEQDGYTLASGQDNANLTQLNFVLRAQLIKTDTAGNTLWTWLSDPTKKIYPACDVIRTSDGGYVYCGLGDGDEWLSANGQSGDLYWKGWIEKLDTARNVQWNKTLSDLHVGNQYAQQVVIRPLPNGDFVVAGSIVDSVSPTWTDQWASLTRVAPNGTVRWLRRYNIPGDTFQCIVHDMKPTPDGGFILAGEATDQHYPYDFPTQRAWIIKVDSNGCTGPNDPQCWPTAVASAPLVAQPLITVFPNPIRESLRIRTAHPLHGDARLTLSDLSGRPVFSTPLLPAAETEVSTAALPPGIYLYSVISSGAVIARGKVVKQ